MDCNYLQYSISDWSQLANCRSNADKDLRISVSKYLNNPDIDGTTVAVTHPKYGTMLAYTIQPSGALTLPLPLGTTDVMRASTLLNELKRYGFYVEFRAEPSLASGQVGLLKSATAFGTTKLRLMRVYDHKDPTSSEIYIVSFDPNRVQDWMNSGYSCSDVEFSETVSAGKALNLSTLANADKYGWDWLYNKVLDIYALLEANASDDGEVIESPYVPPEDDAGDDASSDPPDGAGGEDPVDPEPVDGENPVDPDDPVDPNYPAPSDDPEQAEHPDEPDAGDLE